MREATQRLLELGLSDKEANVYVAMLELGPSGVQDIAEKAGVNRSTTYEVIEDLKARGLASSTTTDKKVLFTAESPKRLEALLHRQSAELGELQTKVEEALPFFMALYNALEDKPRIRFFEGEQGITAIRESMAEGEGEYLSFAAIDEDLHRVARMNEPQRQKMARRIRGRFLMSMKPGLTFPDTDLRTWEVREIPYGTAPFKGEINIRGHKVAAYLHHAEKPSGFLVESKEMAELFRALFNAAWQSAKPVDPFPKK